MKKARILIAFLIVILTAQELSVTLPAFFEPVIEFAQEVSEQKEEVICQAQKKVNHQQKFSFYNCIPAGVQKITHFKSHAPVLNRVILHRSLII